MPPFSLTTWRPRCPGQSSGSGSWCASGRGPTARRWTGAQARAGVVVEPGIVRGRVLREHDELAHIVGPNAEGVELERAPQSNRRGPRLDPRECVPVAHAPPTFHVRVHSRCPYESEGDRTPELGPEPRGASVVRAEEKGKEAEREREMKLTYPSRQEAKRYRREIHEAVEAARKGEDPERDALAWPEGLSRTLLRGLPLPTHTRNSILRSRLMDGDNRLTVAEMVLSRAEANEIMTRTRGTKHRAQRTAAQWQELIERFDRTEQTRGRFCTAHGVAAQVARDTGGGALTLGRLRNASR